MVVIAACEQWRESLGVAPWELQLGHADGGVVQLMLGLNPTNSMHGWAGSGEYCTGTKKRKVQEFSTCFTMGV